MNMTKEHNSKDNFYGKPEATKENRTHKPLKSVHLFMRRICYYQSMNTFCQNSSECNFLKVS